MKCIDTLVPALFEFDDDDIVVPIETPEFVCKKCEAARKKRGKAVVLSLIHI